VRAAVNPSLGLRACLENWDAISLGLREPPRQRGLQQCILEQMATSLS